MDKEIIDPNVEKWINCEFRVTEYFMTQFITGHGSCKTYAKQIGKSVNDICIYSKEKIPCLFVNVETICELRYTQS